MVKMIFITGGSASGKTTLAKQLGSHLGKKAVIVSQDSFYKSTTVNDVNFDHPDSLDFDLQREVLEKLKRYEEAEIPIYDFMKHKVVGYKKIKPAPIVIFEGLFALYYYEIAKLADFKMFVHTPADTRLTRRIQRDIKERGRTIDEIIERWINDVQDSYIKFISHTKKYSDLIVPWYTIKEKTLQALLSVVTNIKAGD